MSLPKFNELNAKPNREVAEVEARARDSMHTLMGDVSTHETSGPKGETQDNETTEDRRRRLLEATLSRVKEETKDSCGTGRAGPAHPSQ